MREIIGRDDIEKIEISLSIVSHGHGAMVRQLLLDIASLNRKKLEIILTLNIPECEEFIEAGRDLQLAVVRNDSPKGYGDNNNNAFKISSGKFFCVLNPDLRLYALNFDLLISSLSCPSVGVVAPMVLSPDGNVEDNARKRLRITTMLKRYLRSNTPEYEFGEKDTEVDWIAGCIMMFKSELFKKVKGFDERFFMYLEDADICIRLKELGFSTVLQPRTFVVHDARRSSRKQLRFLIMHATSTCKYFAKRLYKRTVEVIK